MTSKTAYCMLLIGAVCSAPALADRDRTSIRFDGGIGSQPLRAGGAPNQVQGVNPGGTPWVIERLKADIKEDGWIKADGRGLLLGGGNNVGRNGGQSVRAQLFCGAVSHVSGLVPLEENGDFRIEDFLVPTPPADCASPILLIVNANGSWFAAGIPKD